ncbi:cyclase family protein [Irregularibacter muris]|uniref:Cyclase family protein n=1 Tax=Irregularibacter muris TaxID=1796619 RepID=A0AAE3HCP5_9FIRM|nr:cyclase family protein [Irregularibacter muris]MCR1897636.1 cyclase family protein [Irregularibacter muris]
MFIDLTVLVTPKMIVDAQGNEKKALVGHLGTHFDVMDKEFPLEYIERKAIAFDVSTIVDRDIEISDIDILKVKKDMFVAFHTGFIEREGYGGKGYFQGHPQLSEDLIEKLLELKISIIGIDCAGIRRGAEHTPKDQYCADKNVFVVENICNLKALGLETGSKEFIANTYPIKYAQTTGLPCRVVAKL